MRIGIISEFCEIIFLKDGDLGAWRQRYIRGLNVWYIESISYYKKGGVVCRDKPYFRVVSIKDLYAIDYGLYIFRSDSASIREVTRLNLQPLK
jgi:hypothetical protein